MYSRFMSQSLREGGGAISKFYIRRAYKLCPAICRNVCTRAEWLTVLFNLHCIVRSGYKAESA